MRIPQPRNAPEALWRPIRSFERFSVSDMGYVRNEKTGRVLTQYLNYAGVSYVTLKKEGVSHSRAVAPMVAGAYLPPPPHPWFDTPIHLDGDRANNIHWNLMWRPRWFAIKYVQQFSGPYADEDVRLRILETGEQIMCWDACTRFGLLYGHVVVAAASDEKKSPFGTQYHFELNPGHTNTRRNRRL